MIYIEKNTTNIFALELPVSNCEDTFYFLFEFIFELTAERESIYFSAPDTSPYTCRYNKFELTESDSGSIVGGNDIPLNLKPGQYKYNIYVSTTPITIPGDVVDIIETPIIQTGRMVVAGLNEILDPVYQ